MMSTIGAAWRCFTGRCGYYQSYLKTGNGELSHRQYHHLAAELARFGDDLIYYVVAQRIAPLPVLDRIGELEKTLRV